MCNEYYNFSFRRGKYRPNTNKLIEDYPNQGRNLG